MVVTRARIGLAVSAALAAMSVAMPVAAQQQSQQLERVEVTGSSIRRVDAETALPVQIITREEIARTGASNVEQLMQTIASLSSNGVVNQASASGATTLGLSGISLRGLSSLRTLVLLNGRRIAPYGYGFTNDSVSVDVNSIPLSAIERVEVLKDGASAVYGSDAIAGVVNFILRRDYTGLELMGEYGEARGGSAQAMKASVLYGLGNLARDRFNVMLSANYEKEDPLFGRDRDFARTGINPDFSNNTTSGNTFPANIFPTNGAFGSRNPSVPACPGPYAVLDPMFPANRCRFDPAPLVSLIPEIERMAVFASGKFALNANTELYGEASFTEKSSRVVIQPTPLSDQFTLPLNNPLANQFPYNGFTGGEPTVGGLPYSTILLRPTSPFYPTTYVRGIIGQTAALPDLLVRWRAGIVGNRDTTDTAQSPRLAFGARGTMAGWDYDSALVWSQSRVTQTINDGFTRQSRILPILNSGNVDFFGNGTPASVLAQINAVEFFGDALKTTSTLTSLGGKASRELMPLAGGNLAVAVGAEFRREQYKLDPTQELIQGDLTGFGGNFAAVDRSRNVYGIFGEVSAPVVKNVEITGAVRFDDFGDAGSKVTPKVSARWTIAPGLLARASYGQGFRAPSLLDLFAPQTTGVSPAGLNDPVRCPVTESLLDCATQFPVTNGGSKALKAEESTNITAGLIFEPTRNSSIGVEYFNIDIDNRIRNGYDAADVLNNLTKFGSLVRRGPAQAAFPGLPGPIVDINQINLNAGKLKLSGFDLDARWRGEATPYGRFSLGLSGTYYAKYDEQLPDGSFRTRIDTPDQSTGGVNTRWKHYATVGWQAGSWNVTLAQKYQPGYNDLPGTFEDPSDPTFKPRRVAAYVTYDAQAAWQFNRALLLTLGVRNLTDVDPPYSNAGGQTAFQSGYDPTYGDPRGRFVYGRVNYKFF